MLILGRVTGADQARQEQLAATRGRRPGAGPERHRNGSRLPDQGWKVVSTDVTGGLRVPQSRPNPRGGSTRPVRQDQARKSPPAGVRARTPEDCRADGRATLDSHPGGRAGCVPHPASAALGTCGLAACGTAPWAAVPCGALDSAAVVVRSSKPMPVRTVT